MPTPGRGPVGAQISPGRRPLSTVAISGQATPSVRPRGAPPVPPPQAPQTAVPPQTGMPDDIAEAEPIGVLSDPEANTPIDVGQPDFSGMEGPMYPVPQKPTKGRGLGWWLDQLLTGGMIGNFIQGSRMPNPDYFGPEGDWRNWPRQRRPMDELPPGHPGMPVPPNVTGELAARKGFVGPRE